MCIRDRIGSAHRQARQDGYVGTTPAFTINSGVEDFQRTVQLGRPAVSPRGDARLGFFMICGPGGTQGSQQLYAWSALETVSEPVPGEDVGGSLANGSLAIGSLGSSGPGPIDPGAGDPGEGGAGEGHGDGGPGAGGSTDGE